MAGQFSHTTAIKHLAYDPNRRIPQQTKMGYTIYDGNAYDFPMWKFKTEIKLTSFDADQTKVTAGKISDLIDSLKGDALHLAQRIGVDELKAADGSGIEKLMRAVQDHIFPIVKDEIKALYHEGNRRGGGVLQRNPREPVLSYFERREHWLRMLQGFDPDYKPKDDLLGDLALDNLLCSDMEKKLILTVTKNSTDYDEVKACVIAQHPYLHKTGHYANSRGTGGKGRPSTWTPQRRFTGFRRIGGRNRAFYVTEDGEEYEDEAESYACDAQNDYVSQDSTWRPTAYMMHDHPTSAQP